MDSMKTLDIFRIMIACVFPKYETVHANKKHGLSSSPAKQYSSSTILKQYPIFGC